MNHDAKETDRTDAVFARALGGDAQGRERHRAGEVRARCAPHAQGRDAGRDAAEILFRKRINFFRCGIKFCFIRWQTVDK